MRIHEASRRPRSNRRGQTLITFALLLPLLLGMVGLAMDSGLLLATYRKTQNAADSAALAAAFDLINNTSVAVAKATGATYVQTYNNMATATVTINIPPLSGPHISGTNNSSAYAEAIVSYPYTTSFIQLLGVSKNQTVTARAVAGYHTVPGNGIVALLPNGPGINITGGVSLKVNGPIIDNATSTSQALFLSNGGSIYATSVSVSGTASGGSAVYKYPSGGGSSPLTRNTGVQTADPLGNLAVPTTSNGVVNTNYGSPGLTPGNVPTGLISPNSYNASTKVTTLNPGLYTGLNIGDQIVNFNPGIYVIMGGGMDISNAATLTGVGVMFYNTASTYNASTGVDASSPTFGYLTIQGGSTVNITGIANTSSIYNGMVFFQDRGNSNLLNINNGTSALMTGTVYAPAAELNLAGGATYDAPFIVGSFEASNGATITINPPAPPAFANLVFLVE